MDASEFAQLDQVYDFRLSDFDSDSASAVVSFSIWGDDYAHRSVRMNLITGRLLPHESESSSEVIPDFPGNMTSRGRGHSPSGSMIITDDIDESRQIIVRTADGEEIAVLHARDFPDIRIIRWTPDESAFIYTQSESDSREQGIYAYEIGSNTPRLLEAGSIRAIDWSPDQRFIAFVRLTDEAPEQILLRYANQSGTLLVLDSEQSFKRVYSAGSLVYQYAFSPDGSRILLVELTEDEYGDYDNKEITVLCMESGRMTDLTTNRYDPLYMWCGEDFLAVTTYDEYAVPTLSLIGTDGTEHTELVTDASFGDFEAIEYIPNQRQVIYRAYTGSQRKYVPEELWSVRPGTRPVRLVPGGGSR